MHRLLVQIFRGQFGKGKLSISIIGLIVGLLLVLISMQAYWQINNYFQDKQELSNYLIVNKSVGLGNTLTMSSSNFDEQEIRKLEKQPFVEKLGKFTSNQFKITAYATGKLRLQTELFFEAVPKSFIDDPPYSFHWEEGDKEIPIMLSRDFLRLYNFGFALSQGLPQLSASTIGMVPVRIRMIGPGGKKVMKAKIVGFSERIPSILVPENFLRWANKNIGKSDSQETARLVMKVNNRQNPELDDYLEAHDMQVNSQNLQQSKITGILYTVISSIFIIGTAFIIFALIIVIMNFSLLIAQADREIQLLIQLGYKHTTLLKYFSRYLIMFFSAALIISLAITWPLQHYLAGYLANQGFQLEQGLLWKTIFAGIGFVAIGFCISLYRIWTLLHKVE